MKEHNKIWTFAKVYNSDLQENIFWRIDKQGIHLSQKYSTIIFYIRESWPTLEFFQFIKDAPDIHRFPTVHMFKTHLLLENLCYQKHP